MRAIDTNVLVRLIARDDPAQASAAEQFIEKGAWVSLLALAETVWVLDTVYRLDSAAVSIAIDMLLKHRTLVIQDHDAVEAALIGFRKKPALGFSDCLMLEIARKAGHLPLGTFDRTLASIEGAKRL